MEAQLSLYERMKNHPDELHFLCKAGRDSNIEEEEFRQICSVFVNRRVRQKLDKALSMIPAGMRMAARMDPILDREVAALEIKSAWAVPALFRFFDKQADGYLEEQELLDVFKDILTDQWQRLFHVLDVDGDAAFSKGDCFHIILDVASTVSDYMHAFLDRIPAVIFLESSLIRNALTMGFMLAGVDVDGHMTVQDVRAAIPHLELVDQYLAANLPSVPFARLFGRFNTGVLDRVTAGAVNGQVTRAVFSDAFVAAFGDIMTRLTEHDIPNPPQIPLMPELFRAFRANVPATINERIPAFAHILFHMVDRTDTGTITVDKARHAMTIFSVFNGVFEGSRIQTLLEFFLHAGAEGNRVTLDEAVEVTKDFVRLIVALLHWAVDVVATLVPPMWDFLLTQLKFSDIFGQPHPAQDVVKVEGFSAENIQVLTVVAVYVICRAPLVEDGSVLTSYVLSYLSNREEWSMSDFFQARGVMSSRGILTMSTLAEKWAEVAPQLQEFMAIPLRQYLVRLELLPAE